MPDYEVACRKTRLPHSAISMRARPKLGWSRTATKDRSIFEFAVGRRPGEEFYDINADPHCMNNLADVAEAAEVKASLRTRLMNELTSHR